MSSPFKRRSARAVIAATGFGLVVAPLAQVPAAQAATDGSGVVISEVYLSGGSAGATYNKKYVELYNPTASAIDLTSMSIQYRSATGTGNFGGTTRLTGTIAAHGYYVVEGQGNGTVGAAVPADQTGGGFNPSGTAGTLVLAKGTTAISSTTLPAGNAAGNSASADLVGYGASNTFETAAAPAGPGVASSLVRNETNDDTDNNSADFIAAPPSPGEAYTAPQPPTEFSGTIAEIQGTDAATSPHEGDTATTRGVVTAAYPTGGYNGFYIQTPGTGGATDETPGASDAVFVYGSAATAKVRIGDHVEVTGLVKEFQGTTEIETSGATAVTLLDEPAVTPKALDTALPATEATREAHEGELLAPAGAFTVTNTYATNTFAEIGLAAGTKPLIAPTEIADAQDKPAVAAIEADNAARAITLDDGASANYTGGAKDTPMPWLSKANPIRVGARATFTGPVILEYRNNLWKFQPTSQITGDGKDTATFENTRTDAPATVGGDIRLATFNVLNYFPTTGEEYVAAGKGTCTYYTDRAGNRITVNSCTNNGPRGAANDVNLQRQQAKIVAAINKLDASIVSLEEIENSVQFGKSRDFAIGQLVSALNAAAGSGTWAFAPSPAEADMPTPAQEDVIRTGFIYKPADVELVGASKILVDETHFSNAREPLAQAFKAKGAADSKAFSVIVNHFKSKGSGTDDGTGQGNANPDRIGQAQALSAFADSFATDRKTKAVFLTGDFNSYSMEDPMQVLYGDGYTAVESNTEGEETYSFSGLSGSLDHVLANDAAFALVSGADIWNINSGESVGFEYSRYNNNATDLYEPNQFRASDHDPEIVGINTSQIGIEKVQILGTNDFHGRLENNPTGTEAGAAVMAGAVKKLRSENPNTVFAAAGDLIGASTFASFIAHDKPTIDALNEAGLQVSAVGNHEFDQGYDDLLKRVMAPYDAETNPYGGAAWKYIGANVHKPGAPESELLDPTYVKTFGDVKVGFIGAVTEHLDELVSPAGIEGVEVEDIVTATNREADRLKNDGVDVIVLLVHEGATTTSLESATDPTSDFGKIVDGVDENVDAIVSGHTHLAYNHSVPVKEWANEGREVTERPVVSAGQYGTNLNQLEFTVDSTTGEVVAKSQKILALKSGQTANYPVDAATKSIVDDAVAKANVLGAVSLGQIAGPFNRAKVNGKDANGNPTLVENRGGESTLGNLVAEAQRWATESDTTGSAQIAFMNPGGLRADMVGTGTTYPKSLTYKQAAEVQPFANTLVNMRLTGAQIKTALEQQWQPAGSSRPFLRLGTSKGFTFTYDPAAAAGSRITGMWLDGVAIDPATSYSVTVNSFLASGGDNFGAFNQGTQKKDTGKTDLQGMVDFMAEFAKSEPLAVDYKQHAVGVSFPAGAPESYLPGDEVAFKLSSLAYSTAADAKDAEVRVTFDGTDLGTFPVDNTIGTVPSDEYGTADVTVTLPAGAAAGKAALTVTGLTTRTSVSVPVTVAKAPAAASTTTASVEESTVIVGETKPTVVAQVTAGGNPVSTGTVEVYEGANKLGTGTVTNGEARIQLPAFDTTGTKTLDVRYLGDESTEASSDTVTVEVTKAPETPKATSTTTATVVAGKVVVKSSKPIVVATVKVDGKAASSGRVEIYEGSKKLGTGTVSKGEARIQLPAFDTTGTKTLDVRYLGTDTVAPSSTTVKLEVVKAGPSMKVGSRTTPVHVKSSEPKLTITLAAPGQLVSGKVVVKRWGKVVTSGRLVNGKVTLKLGAFPKTGQKHFTVSYLGNRYTESVDKAYTIRVVR